MREILFRGKTVSGEWVYGFYIENETFSGSLVPTIISIDEKGAVRFDGEGYNDEVFVTPETVGQYTGLNDKNGKKIFEGDIVSGHLDDLFPEDETRYKVIWDDYGWHIRNSTDTDTFEQGWAKQYFEVIGNIYDDPELLGGKENV